METFIALERDTSLDEAEVCAVTAVELQRLTGTVLDDLPHGSLRGFLDAAGRRLETARGARGELIRFLAPQHTGASLARALAEILFVPRRQRTEYRANPYGAPPWDIQRLLLEYALWSLRIDELLEALTKGFCAAHCQRLPQGCCTVLGYDLGLVPQAMLRAQELEARGTGWIQPPPSTAEDVCRYHSPAGCCLRRFKSPACAGMLCDTLMQQLRCVHPAAQLDAWLVLLARFRNHALDRTSIFEVMRQVVEAGDRLLGSR